MSCDLCGASGPTTLVKIEGVPYDVCSECSGYGTPIKEVYTKQKHQPRADNRVVRNDLGTILRKKRQESGKTMEAFAKQLAVKESDLHAWETGNRFPTVEMAEKLGKRLSFSAFTAAESGSDDVFYSRPSGGAMTIADMIKKK